MDMDELRRLGLGFKPGDANAPHKTDLTGKLLPVERDALSENDAGSFRDGAYGTYTTLEDLRLYRVFGLAPSGAGARAIGRFVTTEYAESMIDVKIRLALDIRWKNTKFYEALIVAPKGTRINYGYVAPVTLASGTVLEGGAEQIMLPYNWPDDWIAGYRKVTQAPQWTYPEFFKEKPVANERNHSYPGREGGSL